MEELFCLLGRCLKSSLSFFKLNFFVQAIFWAGKSTQSSWNGSSGKMYLSLPLHCCWWRKATDMQTAPTRLLVPSLLLFSFLPRNLVLPNIQPVDNNELNINHYPLTLSTSSLMITEYVGGCSSHGRCHEIYTYVYFGWTLPNLRLIWRDPAQLGLWSLGL